MTNLSFAFWDILEHFFLNIFDLRQIGRADHIHNTPLIMFLSQSFFSQEVLLYTRHPPYPSENIFLLLEFLAVTALWRSLTHCWIEYAVLVLVIVMFCYV